MIKKIEHYRRMVKYWNSQAKLSLRFGNKSQITNKIMKTIKEMECKNILEIGCGLARDTVVIAQKNKKCRITCIDIAPVMIKKAKDLTKEKGLENRTSFILGGIQDIKLKEDSFDGIIARSVLHHLFSENDIVLACKNIYRSLNPKGIFILIENWANSNPSKYETLAFQLSEKARKLKCIKETFLKKEEYVKILLGVGFRNIKNSFVEEKINLDRYGLNEELIIEAQKIKLAFPKGRIKNLFIVASK